MDVPQKILSSRPKLYKVTSLGLNQPFRFISKIENSISLQLREIS